MKCFKNILVAVDLSDDDRFVADDVSRATAEAIEGGLWLAKLNSADLTFFSALEVSARTQHLMKEDQAVEPTVKDQAQDALSELIDRARQQGINARSRVGFGKSWVEIIRQVLRDDHDLVIAGTRQRHGLEHLLLGTTGLKLLRKCPCPVWVTKPLERDQLSSILVATDFNPASHLALELGITMAQVYGAELHLLHVLEFGRDDHLKLIRISEKDTIDYRERARAEAVRRLELRVAAAKLMQKPHKHLLVGHADEVILQQIEKHDIELLIMATLARTGIPGVLVGNTAERLLLKTPRSILAVKPAGFESPVTLEPEERGRGVRSLGK